MQENSLERRKISFSFSRLLESPEKAFLALALLFGLLFLIALPPFQVPDEPAHLFRAYQLSDGKIIADKKPDVAPGEKGYSVGGLLPLSVINTTNIWCDRIPFKPSQKVKGQQFSKTLAMPLERDKTGFATFMSSIYSPIPYIPQIIGITFGKLFNLPPVWLAYLGRFSNLIITTFITFFSIKIISGYKWLFFLLALTPMALSQRASLSADALVNSVAFLLIATIANCAFNTKKEKVSPTDIAIIVVSGILISLSKQAYFPLVFLFFLIPQDKFSDRKQYWITCLITITSSLFAWVLWSASLKGIGLPTNPFVDASVERQTQFLITHPFTIISTSWNSLQDVKHVLDEFIGYLGWLDTKIPTITLISYQYILVLVALVSSQPNFVISSVDKWKTFLVFAATVFLVYLSQYLIWSPVGAMEVQGVQGRYLIPASPLFFFLFYNRRFSFKISENSFRRLVVYYSIFALLSSLIAVIARYY
jgi:uncharacterized membrane protein